MDTQKLFRRISEKMTKDFEISAEINHNGNIGTYREGTLSKFLSNGRLPARYAIGSGEIVAPTNESSRQSDLIIFDNLDGISLLYEENVQVYPVESIYGVIEVKSTLTKEKLHEALDNIKSVKEIATEEVVTKKIGPGYTTTYKRPKPFGAIFAYQLGNNSLDSLSRNLIEWESKNEKSNWPNIVAVLGEGTITHYTAGAAQVLRNSDFEKIETAIGIQHKEDTLFRFYASILDLCTSTELAPFELWRYFERAEKISGLRIRGHDRITKNDGKKYKLTDNFVLKIYSHCQSTTQITQKELLTKRFGGIPLGLTEAELQRAIYFYNPENFPGTHEVEKPFANDGVNLTATQPMLDPFLSISIDEKPYFIPMAYLSDKDIVLI